MSFGHLVGEPPVDETGNGHAPVKSREFQNALEQHFVRAELQAGFFEGLHEHLNLAKLGCEAELIGVIGPDAAGDKVGEIIGSHGIGNRLVVDKDLPTTTKTRVVANRQQLVRFDEEQRINGGNGCVGELSKMASRVLSGSNVVVLSDYNKGVLFRELTRWVMDHCRNLGIPVLVDPKRGDWEPYIGATLVKPNIYELRAAAGDGRLDTNHEVAEAARRLMRAYSIGTVLVTLGSRGMMLVSEEDELIPVRAREVFDVSGAGDTAIATLAACMCSGYTISEAARIANIAAGVVVGKLGTCPITARRRSRRARALHSA